MKSGKKTNTQSNQSLSAEKLKVNIFYLYKS